MRINIVILTVAAVAGLSFTNANPAVSSTKTSLSRDGHVVVVERRWIEPLSSSRAAIVVLPGLAEHLGRYDATMDALAGASLCVFGTELRGHGRANRAIGLPLGHAHSNAFQGMVDDLKVVVEHVGSIVGTSVPIVLLGHSLGSLVIQRYMQTNKADAVILTGTTGGFGDSLDLSALLKAAKRELDASSEPHAESEAFNRLLNELNRAFLDQHGDKSAATSTGIEWLVKDNGEVERYQQDPMTGFGLSASLAVDTLKGIKSTWSSKNEKRVAKTNRNTPVLMVGGAQDPFSNFGASVRQLASRYKKYGIKNVFSKVYAKGRHHLLHDEGGSTIHGELLKWIDAVLLKYLA